MMLQWRGPLVRGSMLLMEAIWVYALVAFVVALLVGGGKPTFIGTLIVVGGSFTISRVLQGSLLSLGVLRIWGTFLSLLIFYAVVRVDFYGDWQFWDFSWLDQIINNTDASLSAETKGVTALLGVPLLGAFWIRGVLRGQQSIVFDDVLGSFGVGVVVVATVLVFGSFVDELPRSVELIAVPYIAVGLLAIGLTHAARAQDSFEREFTSVWLLAVGGAVGLMALIALLFVFIDFSAARDGLEFVATGVGWVAAGLVAIVAWPVIKILEGVFWFIQFLADLANVEPEPQENQPLQTAPPPEQDTSEGDSPVPGWLKDIARYVVAGGLITALVVGLSLLFRRFQRPATPPEMKESVYESGRLSADLGNLFGSMLGRLRPTPRGPREAEPARLLYFEMLAAGDSRGVVRLPMETPLDLAPRLQRTFGSETPGDITGLFDDVRYGGHEASPDEVQRLRSEWEHLQGR